MKKKSSFFKTILFLCSLILLLFYCLFFFQIIKSNNNKFKKDSFNYNFEKRLSGLEKKLKDNENILKKLKTKLTNYNNINHVKKNFTKILYNLEVFNKSYIFEKNTFNITIEDIYEKIPFDNPDGGVWKQGWGIKLNESKFIQSKSLKVFIVPHSHNDPGWIKTFDQYYKQQTNLILNTMLKKLTEFEKMTFIWAEISYFSLWYENLSEDDKEMVKTLLDNGQLEIVTGGWVMNDEANTHYFSIISQLLEGHEWLIHNLNYKPKIGWAIDPFGVSPTMAFILKKMGFNAMVVQRVHYSIKKYLAKLQFLEFNWKQYWEKINFSYNQKDILCHIMPFYSYDIPHTCGPDPEVCCQFDFERIINTKNRCPWNLQPKFITDFNIKLKSEQLLKQYKKKSMLFKTNSLLVPIGDDFRYENEQEWDIQYKNYQKIFNYINSHDKFNTKIRFSTLSEYFDSVFNEIPIQHFPTLSGDFFTYADKDDNYWSGYFISRPFYKRYNRQLEYHLRSTEILFSFFFILNRKNLKNLDLSAYLSYARKSLALFQHHDALTGTARNHVVKDYAHRLFLSIEKTQYIISSLISSLFYFSNISSSKPCVEFLESFPVENMSYNHVLELNKSLNQWSILLYNSLAISREDLICLNVFSNETWILREPKGKLLTDVQINNINKKKFNEVCFLAKLKPLSIEQYSIEINSLKTIYEKAKIIELDSIEFFRKNMTEFSIESDKIKLFFGFNGMLKKLINLEDNQEHFLNINFVTFETKKIKKKEMSGAYLFMPYSETPKNISLENVKIKIIKGNIVSEVEVLIQDRIKIKHKIKLIKGQNYINIQNEFFLKKHEFFDKELVMEINTGIKNNNFFYTDLNGFQNLKRKFYSKIPLQGNVYPMPTLAYIEDKNYRLNFISGQPLGVTSLNESKMYIFLDRLLLKDDFRGLGQGITDNKPTKQVYQIFIEKTPLESKKSSLKVQLLVNSFLNPLLQMKSLNKSNQGSIEFLVDEFPNDIHLLNFRTNLNSYNNFYLFLHKYLVSRETKKNQNKLFQINKILKKKFLDVLNNNIDLMSLSVLNKERSFNLSNESLFITENDFKVLDFTLKV